MEIEEVRRRNLLLLIAKHGGQKHLAEAAKIKNPSQISQWKNRSPDSKTGRPRTMESDTCRSIEKELELQSGWMDFPHEDGDAEPISNHEEMSPYPSSTPKRVPVRGTASMGLDGFWVDLEYPQGDGDGYFEYPTADPNAYVLRVKGDSMFPAIRSGWYVLIEPNGAIHQGEYVLVKLTDGRSTVKELLWHRHGEYSLLAISSGERLTVPEKDVADIHPVSAVLPPSKRQP